MAKVKNSDAKSVQPKVVKSPLIVVEKPKEITDESAAEIKSFFVPMLDKMEELEEKFNPIMAKYDPNEPPSQELVLEAKALYRIYVSTRTGTEGIRKKVKAYYLLMCGMIDGFGKTQKAMGGNKEEALLKIIKHNERIEAERIQKIEDERIAELKEYDYPGENMNLGNMNASMYETILNGAKLAFNQAKEAEEKAEKERLELEAKTNLFNERKAKLLTFAPYHEQGLTIDTVEFDYELMVVEAEGKFKSEQQRVVNLEKENAKLEQQRLAAKAKSEEERLKIKERIDVLDGVTYDEFIACWNGNNIISREELLGFTDFEFDNLKNVHNKNYSEFTELEKSLKEEPKPSTTSPTQSTTSPTQSLPLIGGITNKEVLKNWVDVWPSIDVLDKSILKGQSFKLYEEILKKQESFRKWSLAKIEELK